MGNFRKKAKTGPPSPLVRVRPTEDGNFVAFYADNDSFSAYVHRDVLKFIESESLRAAPDEAIGLLAGRTCQDPAHGAYTLVMAAEGARGNEVEASPSHVHISANGNASVRQRLEDSHPDREIVGWYHSHPRYLAQFSHVDIAEQSTWNDPHHIGIVFSGTERNNPFGVYRGPGAVRLSRRRAESLTSAAGQTVFTPGKILPERALPEQVAGERTQPGRPKLPAGAITRSSRVPRGLLARFGRLRSAGPRLLAVLTVLAFAAGVVWLHVRVRSIENALGGAKGLILSSPAQAATAETPPPQQPSPSPDTGTRANDAREDVTGAGNRTALNDWLAITPAANPLKGKALRSRDQRAGKSKKPEARVEKNKSLKQ